MEVAWAYLTDLSDVVKIDGFCFVPTVSALDIGNGSTLSTNQLLSGYSISSPPASPYNSPFNSFVTASTRNEDHYTFTTRNSAVLLKELKGDVTTPLSCSLMCNSQTLDISGPEQLCTSNDYYSVSGLPPGWTVNWAATGNLSLPSNPNTNPILVSGNNGTGTLTAIVSSVCGNITLNKSVEIGPQPILPYFFGNGTITDSSSPTNVYAEICAPSENTTIYFDVNGAQNLQAFLGSPGVEPEVNSNTVSWTYPSYPYPAILRLEYDVNCGHIVQYVQFENSCYTNINTFMVYPNPSDSELTITYNDSLNSTSTEFTKDFKVELLDDKGHKIKTDNSLGKPAMKLNTLDVKDGTYYLHIITDKRLIRKQILIQHK